jgi:hypothetical protein
MRELATKRLHAFRLTLWENADEAEYGMVPPIVFLPDSDIKSILDVFSLLQTEEELALLLPSNAFLINQYSTLLSVIRTLHDDFEPIRQQNKAKEKAARAARALQKKTVAHTTVLECGTVESDTANNNSESGEDRESVDDLEGDEKTGIKLRINFKCVFLDYLCNLMC